MCFEGVISWALGGVVPCFGHRNSVSREFLRRSSGEPCCRPSAGLLAPNQTLALPEKTLFTRATMSVMAPSISIVNRARSMRASF